MSFDPQSVLPHLVGGARGNLLDTLAKVGKPHSIRQLADLAGVGHPNAIDLLREFEELGIVRSQKIGRSVVYEPVVDNVLLGLLRRIRTLQKEIVDALTVRAENAPPGVVLAVFGSVATGRASEGSDLDLLAIVDPVDDAANEWVDEFVRFSRRASGLEVNPLRFTPEEWASAMNDRALIVATVQDRHRLLCGEL